jgi:SAM-dependent methyltransferase
VRRCARCGDAGVRDDWTCTACGFAPAGNGVPVLAPEAEAEGDSFDPTAYARLAEVEGGSWWFQGRNRLLAWTLERHFPDAGSLLEIGCGTGFVLAGLRDARPGLRLTGAELYSAGLGIAAARVPGAELVQLDARRLPFEAEFDVVGAFDVLEHVDEDEQVLRELHRATRPGGGIMLTVPQHPWLWSAADEAGRHRRRYRRAELVHKAEAAGFAVERVTSFVTLALPLMAASRAADRRRATEEYDPMNEFRINRSVNAVLAASLTAERALVRAGVSLPAGGSLLLVGRRR